jgi:hypothetical protein
MFTSTLPSSVKASKGSLDKAIAPESAEDKFRAFTKMSPADRMRAAMLSSIGVTEEQLKSMPPDQQKAIEQKIADMVKQAAQKQIEKGGSPGFITDIKA